MEWRIVYFGAKGGGAQLAEALLECLGGRSIGLISKENSEIKNVNVKRISNIPSGVMANVGILFRPKARARLVSQIQKEIGESKCIFVMAHPIDKYVKRKILQKNYWTVIHDVTKHGGDIWPFNRTIRNLALENQNLIFLSKYVRDECLKKFKTGGEVLPLISPHHAKASWKKREYDLAILGRHKKYKNLELGLRILESVDSSKRIFISLPRFSQRQSFCSRRILQLLKTLEKKHFLTLGIGWLNLEQFLDVLSKTKVLLLTHQEASQSGLISMADALGTLVVAPDIGGLSEQVISNRNGILIKTNCIDDYVSAISSLIMMEAPLKMADNFDAWRLFSTKQGIKCDE